MEKREPFKETNGNADYPPTGVFRRLWAWVVLLFMGLTFGYSVILAKVIVASGAHPFGVTMWTSTLAAGFLLAYWTARRRAISFKRNVIWLYVVCGLLGVAIPAIAIYYAALWLSAGVLSITLTVGPILTFLFSVLFGLERFVSIRMLGVAFGVLAVVLLVAPKVSLPDSSTAPWVLLACIPGLCYALENMVLTFHLPRGISPFMITCGSYLVSAIVMVFAVVTTDSFFPLAWPWGTVEWSIVGMAAINALGYGLFIYLITLAGAVFSTQVSYLTTLSGVAWGILIFDEQHNVWVWLSLVFVLVGLTLIRPRKRKQAAK